jgi:hypothetical protein
VEVRSYVPVIGFLVRIQTVMNSNIVVLLLPPIWRFREIVRYYLAVPVKTILNCVELEISSVFLF